MDGRPGRISHYSVLGELGRDELGYVLRAKDEQLDRPVVLRVIRAASAFPPERLRAIRAAFQREAKRAARVSHPNLVTIYAFESIDDVDLMALELVEGASLRAMLALGDRWRVPEAAKLVARVADAIAAAHAAKMTHGRLSLANVIVRPDRRVKVLDLGVPKLPDPAHAGPGPHAERLFSRTSDVRADLVALGLITWELAASAHRPPGALWRPATLESADVAAAIADPKIARTRFGVVGPVIARALAPGANEAFHDAAQFRDAILAALLEPSARTANPAGPKVDAIGAVAADAVTEPPAPTADPDGLGEIDGPGLVDAESNRAPRLVLPADLAEGGTLPPPGSAFVVMSNDGVRARFRTVAGGIGTRVARRTDRIGPTVWSAAAILLVLLIGGVVAARRFLPNEGELPAVVLARDAGGTPSPSQRTREAPASLEPENAQAEQVESPDEPGESGSSAVVPESTAPAMDDDAPTANGAALIHTATVRSTPAGTTISIRGRAGDRWTDVTELSVPDGDSLIVMFSRPGYVTATRTFKGSRLAVALQPDSVFARFESNVPAQVYVNEQRGSPRLLGTTDFTARLPTGSHQLVFRAPEHRDWTSTQRLTTPGRTYTIRKLDYESHGSLLVTVTGTWAWVSIDGGPPQETPLRIERLPVGTHTIRLTREGFASIDDTVIIRPGQTVTKPYTLRPTS